MIADTEEPGTTPARPPAFGPYTPPAPPPLPTDGLVRPLTPAQDRVARLVAAGLYVDEIAHEIGCVPRTVRAHLAAIELRMAVRVRGRTAYRRVQRWARTHLGVSGAGEEGERG